LRFGTRGDGVPMSRCGRIECSRQAIARTAVVIAADAAKRFSWHRQRRGIDFLDLRVAAIRDR